MAWRVMTKEDLARRPTSGNGDSGRLLDPRYRAQLWRRCGHAARSRRKDVRDDLACPTHPRDRCLGVISELLCNSLSAAANAELACRMPDRLADDLIPGGVSRLLRGHEERLAPGGGDIDDSH